MTDFRGRWLLRITPQRKITVLADRYQGKPFLALNDLCLDKAGNVYFTDSGPTGPRTMPGAVYRYSVSGRVSQLDSDLPFPNGIALSKDEKRLYVAETRSNRIYVYDLSPNGTVGQRRIFHQFPDSSVDGLEFDEVGRLWVARWAHGTVDVLGTNGELVASLDAGGKGVTNLAWRGTSLFVTVAGSRSIHRLDVGVRQASPAK